MTSESTRLGKEAFDQLPSKFRQNPILINAAIDMFMGFGEVNFAEHLFTSTEKKDIVTLGAMMKGSSLLPT